MQTYSWWGGDNPPPSFLKTTKQLAQLGFYPKKAQGVIYLKGGKPCYLFNPDDSTSVMPIKAIEEMHFYDKLKATEWARELLAREFIILDTETTGIKEPEICQIAIIDHNANTLLNTLVKPNKPIESKAQAVHYITNDDVKDSPTFRQIYPDILNLLTCSEVVIYNKDFDIMVLNNCSPHPIITREVTDPMPYYAMFKGEWNPYRGEYKYQKLQGNHSALGDCLKTLEIIKEMAR
jgi:DNA polymerase III subunit epsilon